MLVFEPRLGDAADQAQRLEEADRFRAIAACRRALRPAAAEDCHDCGEPIAPERRAAMPSATRCVTCQGRWEKHL